MANLSGVVQQLKKERKRAQTEIERIDAALAALKNLGSKKPFPQATQDYVSSSSQKDRCGSAC